MSSGHKNRGNLKVLSSSSFTLVQKKKSSLLNKWSCCGHSGTPRDGTTSSTSSFGNLPI